MMYSLLAGYWEWEIESFGICTLSDWRFIGIGIGETRSRGEAGRGTGA